MINCYFIAHIVLCVRLYFSLTAPAVLVATVRTDFLYHTDILNSSTTDYTE